MNLFTGETSDALFGSEASAVVRDLLTQAAAFAHSDVSRAEALLWTAQVMEPDCLATWFAMYKFYFYKGRLGEAEQAALSALKSAARRGGFDADWHTLTPTSAPWSDTQSPAHFYLFSLKALSFIRLRAGRPHETRELLAKLAELDPRDQVGASVIREVAAGAAS